MLPNVWFLVLLSNTNILSAQSAGTVEYADCIFEEG